MTTTITNNTLSSAIAEEIEKVHIYESLSYNGKLYEDTIKAMSWMLNMSPQDVNDWADLHIRHMTDHETAQKWMNTMENKYDLEEEWADMIQSLTESYEAGYISKIREMSKLEKAHIIGETINAMVYGEKKGA